MRKGRPLMAAVALLTLAASVGCSGHPDSAATTDPPTSAVPATDRSTLATVAPTRGTYDAPGTTSGTSSTRWNADQQAVIDAHDRAITAVDAARAANDPNDPSLPTVLAHDMLRDTRIDIDMRKTQGMAVRLPSNSKSRIEYVTVNINESNASVTTCELDDRVIYRVADGSIVNDATTTARWNVAMVMDGETWKLNGRQQLKSWPGEEMATCLASV